MSKLAEIIKAVITIASMILSGYLIGKAESTSLKFNRRKRLHTARRVYELSLHDDIREGFETHLEYIEAKEREEKADAEKVSADEALEKASKKMAAVAKDLFPKK